MSFADKPALNLAVLPTWVRKAGRGDPASVGFASGAALAVLDIMLRDPSGRVPVALLLDRLALQAAGASLSLEGRRESLSEIRDAVCLARAGDALGPAGEMFAAWRSLARVAFRASHWRDRVMKLLPEPVAEGMSEAASFVGSPAAQATQALTAVLQASPRQETAALMLADLTLARAVGWERPVPLLAAHLTRADIRAITDGQGDPNLCVHQAIIAACNTALRQSADLGRRADRLRGVAPKLRNKGADHALELFLRLDAVAPSGMLSPRVQGTSVAMSDRAARRLCDRLVALGAVREVTGRATFRLYGL